MFLSVIYLVLSLQLYFGSPPFYEQKVSQKSGPFVTKTRPAMPLWGLVSFLCLVVILLAASFAKLPLVLWSAPVISAAGGLSIRQAMKHQGRDRSLWFINRLSARYPLWLFDLWSLGITFLFGLLFLLS